MLHVTRLASSTCKTGSLEFQFRCSKRRHRTPKEGLEQRCKTHVHTSCRKEWRISNPGWHCYLSYPFFKVYHLLFTQPGRGGWVKMLQARWGIPRSSSWIVFGPKNFRLESRITSDENRSLFSITQTEGFVEKICFFLTNSLRILNWRLSNPSWPLLVRECSRWCRLRSLRPTTARNDASQWLPLECVGGS